MTAKIALSMVQICGVHCFRGCRRVGNRHGERGMKHELDFDLQVKGNVARVISTFWFVIFKAINHSCTIKINSYI